LVQIPSNICILTFIIKRHKLNINNEWKYRGNFRL